MGKPYVLVVDDNRITTKLLRRYLEANGYEASEAYDGIECLEKIAQRLPDAIVLDVMMPRLDGYETVKKIREDENTCKVPVVIVTALNDIANQLKAIDAGSDDFLSKPIEEKLLIAKVKLLSTVAAERRNVETLKNLLEKALSGSLSGSLSEVLAAADIA